MIAIEDIKMGCMIAGDCEGRVRLYAFTLDTADNFVGFAKRNIKAGEEIAPTDYLSGGIATGGNYVNSRNKNT